MLAKQEMQELRRFSVRIRMETLRAIASIGSGHVGGALSIADVLAVLYGKQLRHDPQRPDWAERDWLVVSKGHAGPAVYAALALRGFFPMEQLQTLNRLGTRLPSHCDHRLTTGIDITTGSLGQGASAAAGAALALRMDGKGSRVFLILGDGELDEGQVWEMALFAAHRGLSNLIAFVDNNHLQIDGTTDEVCALGDIADKFRAFGWFAQAVDGHDVEAIDRAVDAAKAQNSQPSVIVLDTVKGCGWSAAAGKVGSHSRTVSGADLADALDEMQRALDEIGGGNA
ncbi:transketolase [Clostridiaceae bacterium]|nr:transketolase [Clostridiaceae bacterium]NBI81875.1 transketolase [Clostridiaceae bacterium]